MSSNLRCIFNCPVDTSNSSKILKFTEETLENCRYLLRVRAESKLKYSDVVFPDQLSDDVGYHATCRKNFMAMPKKYIDFYEERERRRRENCDPGAVASTSSAPASGMFKN